MTTVYRTYIWEMTGSVINDLSMTHRNDHFKMERNSVTVSRVRVAQS